MKIEKDEVSMGYFKTCDECGAEVFEGMNVYYIEIGTVKEDILLCENCINELYSSIDKI